MSKEHGVSRSGNGLLSHFLATWRLCVKISLLVSLKIEF